MYLCFRAATRASTLLRPRSCLLAPRDGSGRGWPLFDSPGSETSCSVSVRAEFARVHIVALFDLKTLNVGERLQAFGKLLASYPLPLQVRRRRGRLRRALRRRERLLRLAGARGHGERSRCKFGGAEHMLILVVGVLAVNRPLPL